MRDLSLQCFLKVAGYPVVMFYILLYVSYEEDLGVIVEQRTEKQPFCVQQSEFSVVVQFGRSKESYGWCD